MPKFCANLTMLFTEHDFLDRFGPRPPAGFTGVEYLFPYAYAEEDWSSALERHGLTQVLHNLPAGDWGAGERGIACLPGPGRTSSGTASARRSSTRRRSECPQVNCLAGMPRPSGPGPSACARPSSTICGLPPTSSKKPASSC